MTFFGQYATLELLKPYKSPSNTSVFKGVPIALRERVLSYYKSVGIKVKLRYRGPRNKGNDTRHWFLRKSNCLKSNATTFTVYTGV